MKVRKATFHDTPFIKLLMESLGYKTSNSILVMQLQNLFNGTDHEVLVCEDREEVIGFAVIHMLPQLAFEGNLLIISYLYVNEMSKDQSSAKLLENFIHDLARKRKCERIQVHCAPWRAASQKFFLSQHYEEYPQYFTKRLMYGE